MAETKLAPLSTQVPITNPKTGTPTTYFQQLMQIFIDEKNATADDVDDVITDISELELVDLADVNIPTPADGQVITWDDTPGEWVAQAPASASLLSAQFEHGTNVNVAGGSSVASAWYGRYLNNEIYDDIGLSLRASTVTITIAAPGVVTWTAHGLVAGSPIVFSTTGALPTGITAGTIYYVIATGLAANTFQFAATANAVTGITTTGSQSGTHTVTSSSISLDAGTYEVDAEGSFYQSNMARIRLRDLTNSVNLGTSLGFYGSSANAGNAHPRILSRFTLSGTAIVHLQYYVISATATQGQGLPANMVDPEVHCRLKITKLS